jgi:hypothetical protein
MTLVFRLIGIKVAVGDWLFLNLSNPDKEELIAFFQPLKAERFTWVQFPYPRRDA